MLHPLKGSLMTRVVSNLSMSLDGFIEDSAGNVGPLFDWYTAGPVETATANETIDHRQSEEDADFTQEMAGQLGALITGRKLFDVAGGWQGAHPTGVPVVVLTHAVPSVDEWPFDRSRTTFVTEGGIEAAVTTARELADGKDIVIASPMVAQQALDAGLLDAITVDLVPVLLGAGTPYWANLQSAPVHLENPTVRQGNRVTHLSYNVIR